MNTTTERTKPRKITYVHLEGIFSKAGYWVTRCHLPRWRILALLWIACNQIAAGKKRATTPANVYACINILFNRVLHGAKWYPNQIHSLWARGARGEYVGHIDKLDVCPCCGQKLPEDLRRLDLVGEDVEEAYNEQFPANVTTFTENEGK